MEFERKKTDQQKLEATKVKTLSTKFGTGGIDFIEEHLQSTGVAGGVGLVTNQEYKKRKERVELTIAEEEEKLMKSEVENRKLRK